MKASMGKYILSVVLAVLIYGCSGQNLNVGVLSNGRLAGCSHRPNCVSSEAQDAKHTVSPLRLKGDPAAGWEAIREAVGRLPRTIVVKTTNRYLHAECKSILFGFIDDLELLLDPSSGVMAIRSASRIGYSDFGVNRRRVTALGQMLLEKKLIQ
jgi:uncharacterized protein (DUF1499 family)